MERKCSPHSGVGTHTPRSACSSSLIKPSVSFESGRHITQANGSSEWGSEWKNEGQLEQICIYFRIDCPRYGRAPGRLLSGPHTQASRDLCLVLQSFIIHSSGSYNVLLKAGKKTGKKNLSANSLHSKNKDGQETKLLNKKFREW